MLNDSSGSVGLDRYLAVRRIGVGRSNVDVRVDLGGDGDPERIIDQSPVQTLQGDGGTVLDGFYQPSRVVVDALLDVAQGIDSVGDAPRLVEVIQRSMARSVHRGSAAANGIVGVCRTVVFPDLVDLRLRQVSIKFGGPFSGQFADEPTLYVVTRNQASRACRPRRLHGGGQSTHLVVDVERQRAFRIALGRNLVKPGMGEYPDLIAGA
ncbi:hypothetical protein D3C85_476660 [compost metagenome]